MCHCTTVIKRLVYDFNLKAFKLANNPCLTPAMKTKKLAFTKQYEDWDQARLSTVLFSDESTIQQFSQKKRSVIRTVGTRFNDFYTQTTIKHPFNIIIWGPISSDGTAVFFTNFYEYNERR